jgi:hypothetical protein
MVDNATQRGGRIFRGRKPDLDYYDRLPAGARQALANAAFDWSGAIFTRWKRKAPGFKDGAEITDTITKWDAAVIARGRMR